MSDPNRPDITVRPFIAHPIAVPKSIISKEVLNFIDAPREKKVYNTGTCRIHPIKDDKPISMVNIAKAFDGLIVTFTVNYK